MTLKDWFDNWYSEALGLLASIGTALDPTTLFGILAFIWAKISTIFTMLSIGAWTVVPRIPFLDPISGFVQGIAIAAGVLLILKLGSRLTNTNET